MTTAHRPTWKAAVAQGNESGFGQKSSVQSVRDIASHTKLKVRSGHQYIESRDSRIQASLEKIKQAEEQLGRLKENAKQIQLGLMPARKVNPATEKEGKKKLLLLHDGKDEIDENALRKKYDDSDELPKNATSDGWSDDDSEKLDGSFSDSSSDDDDDDDDDEVALQAELLKIRREREESAARKAAEEAAEEAARMEEIAVTGNPLLAGAGGNVGKSSKRRWNEDTVFRNQARDAPSGQHKKRFVNDTVRNDFHRRFLNKFIR